MICEIDPFVVILLVRVDCKKILGGVGIMNS